MRKICKSCRKKFEAKYSNQHCCCDSCLKDFKQKLYLKQKEKAFSKRGGVTTLKTKNSLKSQSGKGRSVKLRMLVSTFNAYIRKRDEGLPCISCGQFSNVWHAGHFKTVKAFPELRFNEDNVHKQCENCNVNLSGNVEGYRLGLIKKIGIERVEQLEIARKPLKLTISEIEELINLYKNKKPN